MSRTGPNAGVPPASVLSSPVLAVALPAAAALAYALAHLNWYLGTPLGQVPVLDERENIDLAEAIFTGQLGHAPFYRAPGYALVLAGLRCAGVTQGRLFPAALVLGAFLHAANAGLVAAVARRWFGSGAALVAGGLFALDPVFVHFATQALDSTLALTLFLVGLCAFARAAGSGRAAPWTIAGLAWAGATFVRPNYLLVWAALPAAAWIVGPPGRMRLRASLACLAGGVLFGAAALWQWEATGSPGLLPWQGAYNLWAANRPGTNGRYYSQRISLPPELARTNPARAESILLYAQETKGAPPDIARMNAHWRARFLEEIVSHPLRWAKLLARKAYALLNNWEQYNNETFAFHKALSPYLAWNPIGWGLLFVFGVAGGARLAFQAPRISAALALVWAACAASILLFFVSARFRLPLAALWAILAGGACAAPRFWAAWTARGRAGLAAAMLAAAVVAFSHFDRVNDTATFVQDHALLARAAFTVGDDALAEREATEALKLQPWHPDAVAVQAAARAELAKRGSPP